MISELRKVEKEDSFSKLPHTKKKCFTKTVGNFLNKLSRDHYYRRN